MSEDKLLLCEVRSGQLTMNTANRTLSGTRRGPTKGKLTRVATFGGYNVTGWRYLEDATWHVKIWLGERPGDWMGYTVTNGEFELETGTKAHKEAVLHVITEWDRTVA